MKCALAITQARSREEKEERRLAERVEAASVRQRRLSMPKAEMSVEDRAEERQARVRLRRMHALARECGRDHAYTDIGRVVAQAGHVSLSQLSAYADGAVSDANGRKSNSPDVLGMVDRMLESDSGEEE